jgi:NTP pyrophosphatase (non-canonical NTP hydrolase)
MLLKKIIMNNKEYIENVVKTESIDFEAIEKRLISAETIRLLHASMGIETEAGEFLDVLKKFIFYGKQIDKVNLVEELGDLLWYIGIACDELSVSFEEIMIKNINKLKARYENNTFKDTKAIGRDLKKERKILEDD